MARLYLDERKLREVGFDEPMIRTLRKLTEFVEAQEALEEAQADIADQGDAIDDANTDITAANAAINALDTRIDAYDALAPFVRQNQAANPAYTPYAGQNVSVGYVEAEAQATDDAVLALSTAFNTLLTRLDTVNLLTP
jgi:chromosome segregation ATPase